MSDDIVKALKKASEMSAIFEYQKDIVIGGSKMYPLLLEVAEEANAWLNPMENNNLIGTSLHQALTAWAKAVNDATTSP